MQPLWTRQTAWPYTNTRVAEKEKKEKERESDRKKKGIAPVNNRGQIQTPQEVKKCHFHPNSTTHTTDECSQFKNSDWGRGREEGTPKTRQLERKRKRKRKREGEEEGVEANFGRTNLLSTPKTIGRPLQPTGGQGEKQEKEAETKGTPLVPPANFFPGGNQGPICFNCHQPGHMARDCANLKFQQQMMTWMNTFQTNNKPGNSNYLRLEKDTSKQVLRREGERMMREKINPTIKNKAKGLMWRKFMRKKRREIKNSLIKPDLINKDREVQPPSQVEKRGEGQREENEIEENEYIKDSMPIFENEWDHMMIHNSKGEKKQGGIAAYNIDEHSKEGNYTSTYTTVRVYNKVIHSLADTGASNSIIAKSWLKYLGCTNQIRATKVELQDAQDNKIPVLGEITLPVEFGKETFDWDFVVAEELFCPMIIGVDLLHTGGVDFEKGRVKIQGQYMPIVYTLEPQQHTVVAAMNKVIPPNEVVKIKGRVLHSGPTDHKSEPQTYVVNTGGMLVDSLLVNSKIYDTTRGKERIKEQRENVTLVAMNLSNKPKQIKRGDLLATLRVINEQEMVNDYEVWDAIHSNHAQGEENINNMGVDAISTTNTPEEDSPQIGVVASIVAIRLKQEVKNRVSRVVQSGVDGRDLTRQPELKGGLGREVSILQSESAPTVHNLGLEKPDEGVNMSQEEGIASRKDFKGVPSVRTI